MDKQTGFVKAKVYKKRRKILSAKIGERRTMVFILRPEGNGTNVMLTIYVEGNYFGGDVSSRTQYYEDIGIVDIPEHVDPSNPAINKSWNGVYSD